MILGIQISCADGLRLASENTSVPQMAAFAGWKPEVA